MKKKLLFSLLAILIVATLPLLAACNRQDETEPKSNICRETLSFYAGENENFSATVEFGRREKQFIADGKATDVTDFVQLTVVPLKSGEYDAIAYELKAEDKSLSGTLEKPSHGEYNAIVTLDFAPTSICLNAGETSCEIPLANVLTDCLSADDAINIAKDAFKDRLEKEAADGKPEREIYLKLITGDRKTYYYYVSFIGEGVDYWAALVSPTDGEVVSRK